MINKKTKQRLSPCPPCLRRNGSVQAGVALWQAGEETWRGFSPLGDLRGSAGQLRQIQ